MVYKVSIKKNAIKALQVILDPYFSKIKIGYLFFGD